MLAPTLFVVSVCKQTPASAFAWFCALFSAFCHFFRFCFVSPRAQKKTLSCCVLCEKQFPSGTLHVIGTRGFSASRKDTQQPQRVVRRVKSMSMQRLLLLEIFFVGLHEMTTRAVLSVRAVSPSIQTHNVTTTYKNSNATAKNNNANARSLYTLCTLHHPHHTHTHHAQCSRTAPHTHTHTHTFTVCSVVHGRHRRGTSSQPDSC